LRHEYRYRRLHTFGRAFLDALVARLGYAGAGEVLMLLAVDMKLAAQREACSRDGDVSA